MEVKLKYKKGTFYGLAEIIADIETDSSFERRKAKLLAYNENSEGRLERFLQVVYSGKFTTVLEHLGDEVNDYRPNGCTEHGLLDTNWENNIKTLENVSDGVITKARIGAENLMFLLEDLQPDDAAYILSMLRGDMTSQLFNVHLLRGTFGIEVGGDLK